MDKNPSALQNTIEDFINGNLTDAKKKAKRFSSDRLITYMHVDMGWDVNKALVIAKYLKGRATFEEVCRAK
jgi:hypothetical protein